MCECVFNTVNRRCSTDALWDRDTASDFGVKRRWLMVQGHRGKMLETALF